MGETIVVLSLVDTRDRNDKDLLSRKHSTHREREMF